MAQQTNNCPLGHGELKAVETVRNVTFRDTSIVYELQLLSKLARRKRKLLTHIGKNLAY